MGDTSTGYDLSYADPTLAGLSLDNSPAADGSAQLASADGGTSMIPVGGSTGGGTIAQIGRVVGTLVKALGTDSLAAVVQAISVLTGQQPQYVIQAYARGGRGGGSRRRGITGRQLAITGRTLRRLHAMNKQVAKYTSSWRHSSSSGHHHKGKR